MDGEIRTPAFRVISLLRHPAFLLAASLAGWTLLAFWMPLPPNRLNPEDVLEFSYSLPDGWLYVGLIGLLHAAYWQLAVLIRRESWRPSLGLILALGLLLALPTLFTYPINATDLFQYALRSRIYVFYGGNPFARLLSEYPAEPLLRLTGEWADSTTPYGPIWEIAAGGLTWLAGDRLLVQLLLFKLLVVAAHLGIGGLIWAAGDRTPAERRWLAALWSWNPALLLIFGVDGHNDALMLLWLVGGAGVLAQGLRRQRPAWAAAGLLLVFLGGLTKAIGLLALPVFGLHALARLSRPAGRLRLVAFCAAGGAILTFLAFLPFGSPLLLTQRLASEASEGASYSIFALFFLWRLDRGLPLLWDPAVALSVGGLLLLMGWVLWRTWGGRSPHRTLAEIFWGYILLALNFRIWYAAWSFPFVLLQEKVDRRRIAAAAWFLLAAQWSVFIYGHLREFLLDQNDYQSHLIAVPFVFGVPLLVYWGTGNRERGTGNRVGGSWELGRLKGMMDPWRMRDE